VENINVRFKEVRYARIRNAPYLGLNMDSPHVSRMSPRISQRTI